jgi:hypothetical protein
MVIARQATNLRTAIYRRPVFVIASEAKQPRAA